MKRVARLVVAVVAIFVVSTPIVVSAEGVPALQVTAANGAISLLVPDVHIPYPGLRQPLSSVLQGKARLVIESSFAQGEQPAKQDLRELLAPNAMASLMTRHSLERAPWAMSLSDQEVTRLKSFGQCLRPPMNGQTIDFVLSLRTAAVAVTIAGWRCSAPGQLSRDEIFSRAAAEYGVPIETLETGIALDAQRKAVPARIYEEQLHMGLDPGVEQMYIACVAALNRGDYDAVLQLANSGYANSDDAAKFYRLMIEARNRAWMAPLQRYLDEGDAVVLVGAGHLSGRAGLIQLLESAGYRVEQTLLPADPAQG